MSDRRRTAHRHGRTRRSFTPIRLGVGFLLAASVATLVAPGAWAAVAGAPPPSPVVMIGVAGLTWDDVNPLDTPTLFRLAGSSSDGALLVRGVRQRTCAADGWLSLGSGTRTLAPRPLDGRKVEICPPLTEPTPTSSGYQVGLDLAAVDAENADYYSPVLGNVGDSLAASGVCSTAVGPGAALMLMTDTGMVARYVADPRAVDRRLLTRCPLTAIDLGQIPPAPRDKDQQPITAADESGAASLGSTRDAAIHALDAEVGHVLDAAPPNATVLLVSTADESWEPRIRVLTVRGPGPDGTHYGTGVLWSPSTRQPGLVQLTDVTALVLATLQVEPSSPILGSVPTTRSTDLDTAAVVRQLARQDLRAQAIRITAYTVTQGVAYVLAALVAVAVIQWAWLRRRPDRAAVSGRLARFWQAAFVYVASLPVATFLANLFPWDRSDAADTAASTVIGISLALALVVTVVALIGPWRRGAFGPEMVVAVTTFAVLVADVTTGSRLQLDSLFGLAPLVGGRFYGFGNVAFSLFGVAALFTAVGMVGPLITADRRRLAAAVTAGFGLLVALIDGWPAFGADFGGMIALVAAFATMATLVLGKTLSWRRVVGIAAAAVVVPVVVAVLDWLRPPESRTHLGQFVQSVIDGTAGAVVVRKGMASISSFGDFLLAPLIPVVLLGLAVVVLSPERARTGLVREAYRAIPALQAGLIGCLVLAVVGWLVNDSGLIVAEVVMLLAIPLGAAAVVAAPRAARPPAEPATPSGSRPREATA